MSGAYLEGGRDTLDESDDSDAVSHTQCIIDTEAQRPGGYGVVGLRAVFTAPGKLG